MPTCQNCGTGLSRRGAFRRVVQELDWLLANGLYDPGYFRKEGSWDGVKRAVDGIAGFKATHGQLYRSTRMGIRECEERLKEDPDDKYSVDLLIELRDKNDRAQ